MSSIVLTGDTSGTITVSAPAVAGTRTLTLPAATGTVILEDASGVLQMNSGYGSLAPAYGCRAWVNFNGTGTVAIRDSGNVSSITDNTTGDYTVNFTTAISDANYSATLMLGRDGSNIDVSSAIHPTVLPTTSALRIRTAFLSQVGASTYADLARINIAVFR